MFTHSFSSSSFFQQPLLRNSNSEDHHLHEKKGSAKEEENTKHSVDDSKQTSLERFNLGRKHSSQARGVQNENNIAQKLLQKDLYHSSKQFEKQDLSDTISVMAVQSTAVNINKSADIEFVTDEGDIVSIKLSQVEGGTQSSFQMQEGENNISIYSEKSSSETSLKISIEGDLNEDEQKALKKLMKKMEKVTKHFFNGQEDKAFKHAQKIGFNSEQVASFSLNLKMEKSVEAVAAYQQTAMPSENVDTNMLQRAAAFLAETKEFFADSKASLAFLDEPKQAFTELFSSTAQLTSGREDSIEENDPAFINMVEIISDDLYPSVQSEAVKDDVELASQVSSSSVNSFSPIQSVADAELEIVDSIMALQSLSTNISKTSDIQIVTQEGDVVTISFNLFEGSSQNAFQMQQGGNSINVYTESYSGQFGFEFSIDGDLNADELKSITDLMQKMNKVSKQFFNGNVDKAFEHAQKMGFDSGQLASFSMDLNMVKSVEAIAAYQQTAMPTENVNNGMLMQAAEFLAETKAFLADSKSSLISLMEPKQIFSELFSSIGQINTGTEDQLEQSEPAFLNMIENINDDLFA